MMNRTFRQEGIAALYVPWALADPAPVLAAAAELRKLGHSVEILERADSMGGVLSQGIPPFRLDRGFVESELDYVRRLGVDVTLGRDERDPAALLDRGFAAVVIGAARSWGTAC